MRRPMASLGAHQREWLCLTRWSMLMIAICAAQLEYYSVDLAQIPNGHCLGRQWMQSGYWSWYAGRGLRSDMKVVDPFMWRGPSTIREARQRDTVLRVSASAPGRYEVAGLRTQRMYMRVSTRPCTQQNNILASWPWAFPLSYFHPLPSCGKLHDHVGEPKSVMLILTTLEGEHFLLFNNSWVFALPIVHRSCGAAIGLVLHYITFLTSLDWLLSDCLAYHAISRLLPASKWNPISLNHYLASCAGDDYFQPSLSFLRDWIRFLAISTNLSLLYDPFIFLLTNATYSVFWPRSPCWVSHEKLTSFPGSHGLYSGFSQWYYFCQSHLFE